MAPVKVWRNPPTPPNERASAAVLYVALPFLQGLGTKRGHAFAPVCYSHFYPSY